MFKLCSPSSMQGLCSSKTRVWMRGQGVDLPLAVTPPDRILTCVNLLGKTLQTVWVTCLGSSDIRGTTLCGTFPISLITFELRQWNPRPPWRGTGRGITEQQLEGTREMVDNQAGHSSRHPTLPGPGGICLWPLPKPRPQSSTPPHSEFISDLETAEAGRC